MVSPPSESELRDRQAIKQLKHQYARHLDAQNWEEWGSLFTADAQMVASAGQLDGRDAIVEHGRTALDDRYDRTLHTMHNPIIDVDGDEATGNWYLEAFLTRNDGVAGLQYGEYDETYRRTDDGWRIAALEIDVVAETGDDLTYAVEFDERRQAELRRIRLGRDDRR